jgi:hypothetical protein
MRHPDRMQETAYAIFGKKELLPVSTFCSRSGMGRQAVMRLVANQILDVVTYRTEKRRKAMVTKSSFLLFLRTHDLRKVVG